MRAAPAAAEHGDQARPAARAAAVHQGLHGLTAPPGSAAPRGHGSALGLALLLAGYLLVAPPIFVLTPLAGLLLLSHPATRREWVWLGAALLWTLVGLTAPAGLADDVVRAWAVLLTGAFLATTLWAPRPLFTRTLIALGVAVAGTAVWSLWLGLDWGAVELAVGHQTREALRLALENVGGAPGNPEAGGRYFQLIQMASDGAGPMARLFPALMGLLALAGLALAWAWYRRIAVHPLPPAAGRFRDFDFSDQLVWGLVVAFALVLARALPLPGAGLVPPEVLDTCAWIASNLLLFLGALYALRGVAVLAARLDGIPAFLWLGLGLGALLVLPIAVLGLGVLGLADTWLHFRRRQTAP